MRALSAFVRYALLGVESVCSCGGLVMVMDPTNLTVTLAPSPTVATECDLRMRTLRDMLEDAFGAEFHIFHALTGELLLGGGTPLGSDEPWLADMIRAAGRCEQPQCLADGDGVILFAVPLTAATNAPWVAAATFATRVCVDGPTTEAMRILGLDGAAAHAWINSQPSWPPHALERLGRETLRHLRNDARAQTLESEVEKVSSSLASSYEEISLLHGISQNFRLSRSDEELGTLALEWLRDCLPTQGLALLYLPLTKAGDATYQARTEPTLLIAGDCPLSTADDLLGFVDSSTAGAAAKTLVFNHSRSTRTLPVGVRQAVIAPLLEGERCFGYLLALNHSHDGEFGTVEANLLSSVSSMLGVHCSNHDLYRQQDEFLASVVRALTSAIDAKDPYTCGHSDRVARVATRLAQHLGCDTDFLSTIYMAGLLHDIGKIGIHDAVLRKTGRLTDGEFEHIKQHPALGYKILADIKQFSTVLPAVLHHHEQWDGRGYPCQLAGEQIPYMARILSVADAYDAMTSNRPYRPGMPEDKMRKIFESGAGRQWDAEVVAAFFAVYDDIRAIVRDEQAGLSIDVEQWLA